MNDQTEKKQKSTFCHTCHKPGTLRCSICTVTFYCSTACQKQSWPAHKERCRSFRAENDDADLYALHDPFLNVFRTIAPKWINEVARDMISFAATSAFKLGDLERPSTLSDTHVMLLYTEYDKDEPVERHRIKFTDGKLATKAAILAEKDHLKLGPEMAGKMKEIIGRQEREKALNPLEPFLRCCIIFIGSAPVHNPDKTLSAMLPVMAGDIAVFTCIPTEEIPYQDHEGEHWLAGLQQNCQQDHAKMQLELAWRARLRIEIIKKRTGKPVDGVSDFKPYLKLPNRQLDHAIDFDRPVPEVVRKMSDPLRRCPSLDCHRKSRILIDDPETHDEREKIIRDYLIRDLEETLTNEMIKEVEDMVDEGALNQSRILQLALGGMSIEELCDPDFAYSNAVHFVRMMINRCHESFEEKIGGRMMSDMQPFSSSEDNDNDDGLSQMLRMIQSAMLQSRGPQKKSTGPPRCTHDLYDLGTCKELIIRPSRPLPKVEAVPTRNLFIKLERHIQRGWIKGNDWKFESVWQEGIKTALKVFASSLRQAIITFVATTPTFCCFHRQAIRDFPHLIQFISLTTGSINDMELVSKWIGEGGMMKKDDPIFRKRELELELIRNEGVSSGKSVRNAKKKAKKLAKLQLISAEEEAMLKAGLD